MRGIEDSEGRSEPHQTAEKQSTQFTESESAKLAITEPQRSTTSRKIDQIASPTPTALDTNATDDFPPPIEPAITQSEDPRLESRVRAPKIEPLVRRKNHSLEWRDRAPERVQARRREEGTERGLAEREHDAFRSEPVQPVIPIAEPDAEEYQDTASPTAKRPSDGAAQSDVTGALDATSRRREGIASSAPVNPLLSRESFPQSFDVEIQDRIEERPDLTPAARPEQPTVHAFRAEAEEDRNGAREPESRDDAVKRVDPVDAELMRLREELRVAKAQIEELSRRPFSRSAPADTRRLDAGQERGTDVRIGQIDVIVEARPERRAVAPPRETEYASRAYLRRL